MNLDTKSNTPFNSGKTKISGAILYTDFENILKMITWDGTEF